MKKRNEKEKEKEKEIDKKKETRAAVSVHELLIHHRVSKQLGGTLADLVVQQKKRLSPAQPKSSVLRQPSIWQPETVNKPTNQQTPP